MELLTSPLREQLLRNYRDSQLAMNHGPCEDLWPVVKLFAPWNQAVWLLTELDPDGEILFGLCDLGYGIPELRHVYLSEIASLEGPADLRVERDILFEAKGPLGVYAEAARTAGRIVELD